MKYLKEDIQKDDKLLGIANFDYVNKTLAALKETDSIANCWKEIERNLNTLKVYFYGW